jgi:tetratricopeptide (TPR) repeat protein
MWQEGAGPARELAHESELLFQTLGDKWGTAFACHAQGLAALWQNDLHAARILFERSIALYQEIGDRWRAGEPIDKLGNLAQRQGDYTTAKSLYEESLAIARELDDKFGIAVGLSSLGDVAYAQGDYTRAQQWYEESLALRVELNDKLNIGWVRYGLGKVAGTRGELNLAEDLMTECLLAVQATGERGALAWVHQHLGQLALQISLSTPTAQADRFRQARQRFQEAIKLARLENHRVTIAFAALGCAGLASMTGKLELAACLWSAAHALEESSRSFMSVIDRVEFQRLAEVIQGLVDVQTYAEAAAAGGHMSLDQVADMALKEL